MPSQHPHPSQRQYSEVTVRQTGLIPHHLLYHHSPHDRKNDHSCSEYSTRNSDSVATQTPHIHHQARGARLGVNLRNPTPCVYTCLGRGYFFFWEKVRWLYACIQFFHVRLAGFILYSIFFYLSGCFSRERGRSLVDARYCSSALLQSLRTRAHFHFRSSPHFRRPSLLLFFSNEHFLFRLISSHLKLPLSMPQYHPTISVLLLTLQGVKSPLLLSSMFFFCVIIALFDSFDPWGALLLSSRGTTGFPFWLPCPTPLPHSALITPPHVFPKFSHVQTHTHNHISSPHTPPA